MGSRFPRAANEEIRLGFELLPGGFGRARLPFAPGGPMRNGSMKVAEQAFLVLVLCFALSRPAHAQTTGANPTGKAGQPSSAVSAIPDLSGNWDPEPEGPEGIRLNQWDSSDPFSKHPELAPMTPWALERFNKARPPFGARQTMQDTNDPVQRYCDPPGVPRIYMYPWLVKFIQLPDVVYIIYEYTKTWRAVPLNAEHPADPDKTWMGDSVGRYEDGAFVIDTIGFNDKTWLDQVGHPHSDALHVIERFRRLNQDTLELNVTIDDPKAYTRKTSASKLYKFTTAPMGETICSYSEMKAFQQNVVDKVGSPAAK
jgi:hypothetical protein